MQWMPGRVKDHYARDVLVKKAQRDMCFCMIEQVLSFLYYISPLVSHWREKGGLSSMLENDLFSDVAAASCNLGSL